jgi:histidinol-phosphate phosphatase family protein
VKGKARAVFVDRDGVLVEEVDYLVEPDQLKLIGGSAAALKSLRRAGYKLIVISNQSAVARGMLSLRGLGLITARLKKMLGREGARLDAFYYCVHHPQFTRPCACRKPGQALVKQAAKRFHLDLSSSYFVGDTTTDMATARRAGMTALLVRTGYGGKDGGYRARPHKTFRRLSSAAAWILKQP